MRLLFYTLAFALILVVSAQTASMTKMAKGGKSATSMMMGAMDSATMGADMGATASPIAGGGGGHGGKNGTVTASTAGNTPATTGTAIAPSPTGAAGSASSSMSRKFQLFASLIVLVPVASKSGGVRMALVDSAAIVSLVAVVGGLFAAALSM